MQQPLAPFVYPDFTQELVSSNGTADLSCPRIVAVPGSLLDALRLTPYRLAVPPVRSVEESCTGDPSW